MSELAALIGTYHVFTKRTRVEARTYTLKITESSSEKVEISMELAISGNFGSLGEEWNGTGDSGAIDIGIGDGDQEGITAIFPTFKGELFVAKRSSLYRIRGLTPETFQITKISDSIGCTGANAVAQVDQDDIVFMSDKGIHSLVVTEQFGDFSQEFLSKDIQRTFNDDWSRTRLDKVWMAYIPEVNSIAVAITDTTQDNDAINSAIWLYNFKIKGWYRWTSKSLAFGAGDVNLLPCQSMIMAYDDNLGKQRLYVGTNLTRIGRAFNGTNNDKNTSGVNKAIRFKVQTGIIFTQESPFLVSGFKTVSVYWKPEGDVTITSTAKKDNFVAQTLTFTKSGVEDLLGSTFILGTSRLGFSLVLAPYSRMIDGYGRGIQLSFEQTSASSDVEIQGFAIEYAPVGVKNETRGIED